MPELNKATYLGDGVYGRFDGENVWLSTDQGEIAINRDNWAEIHKLCTECIGTVKTRS